MRPLAITGLGVVSAAGVGYDRFREAAGAAEVDLFTAAPTTFAHAPHPALRVAEVPAFDPKAVVGDKGLRNNDRLTRLLLVASRLGLAHAGIKVDGAFTALGADAVGVCASTAYGSIKGHLGARPRRRLEDPRYLNPGKFPNTVINSAAGYVSIWDDLRARNACLVTNGPTGGVDVFDCAATYLGAGAGEGDPRGAERP
ncbi:MAG: beta-ketoacyl synthase N-terminal-like domain-containing protein [Polyangiales bacterium]